MPNRWIVWPRLGIGIHLAIVIVASWLLAHSHSYPLVAALAVLSGVSLFVLTGLVHEASHWLLARPVWLNELAGNLAGWALFTPLSAYRAFHLKHHQTTNRADDPNAPLNSRWMLLFGSPVYMMLIHSYVLRNVRGRQLARYLLEMAGMVVFIALLLRFLPSGYRDRSWLLPMAFVIILQNIRIVSEHLDLPAGRYQDTWQLVLPKWLSRWLLYYDHHLEHHLRPGLHWHELPDYRAELIATGRVDAANRVTFGRFFRDVFDKHRADEKRHLIHPAARGSTARMEPLRPQFRHGQIDGRSYESRYHGLDALRAATMLVVVAIHAALAYTCLPLPNLVWLVQDPSANPAFDLFCWWSLGISSPFYLMSGFFARELYATRGSRTFVVNRARRIVAPFLVAGLVVFPATFLVWSSGWMASGRCTFREFRRMRFLDPEIARNLFGPVHLWSLEFLAIFLVAFWLLVEIKRTHGGQSSVLSSVLDRAGRLIALPWRPLFLALPTCLILWSGHALIGLDALLDRHNSFVPDPFRLLHNGFFFAAGVIIHRSRSELPRLAKLAWTYLALSCPVFAVRAYLVERDLTASLTASQSLVLAASGALFTWLLTFGCLGLALRASRPWPAVRYLSDASYWIYLCHLPIVGLVQVGLFRVQTPAMVKFLAALGISVGLGLASYQVLVRYTMIGAWLHGHRERFVPNLMRPARRRSRIHHEQLALHLGPGRRHDRRRPGGAPGGA
jgi:peptidoglycan/LPS O-acetylase OafA/YrhL